MSFGTITRRRIGPALLVLAMLTAAFWAGSRLGDGGDAPQAEADAAATTWTCSMHPQFQLPEPGQCPVCFMDLIPAVEGAGDAPDPATLELTPAAAALAEIETRPVERAFVPTAVRLVGQIAYVESDYRKITARVAGRLDTLFVATTGEAVAAGAPLASLYSPALLSAQTELLAAAAAVDAAVGSELLNGTTERTLHAARDRLRQWGLTRAQVAGIEARGEPTDHLRILAPISGVVVEKTAIEGSYVGTGAELYSLADLDRVWVELEAFESDLPYLRAGQTAAFTLEALPGRSFDGEVVFIDPVLDRRTRTATVRLVADNPDGRLRPGLFVRAVVEARLDADGAPVLDTDAAEAPLVVPASAPLRTGRRAVVYVREPGETPRFTGREVILGPRAGDSYLVVDGLEEGDLVVVEGNFKIDSALQIQARPSMMNPVAAEDATPHDCCASPPAEAEVPALDVALSSSLAPVVDGYLALQTALAGDDLAATRDAAAGMAAAIVEVDVTGADAGAVETWTQAADRLGRDLTAWRGADDLATVRNGFDPFSDAFWTLLTRAGKADAAVGDRVLRLFHCPMFGDGGDWIQTSTSAANPYFGASMLRCGSQTDTLSLDGGVDR